jgi:hypothetical protein
MFRTGIWKCSKTQLDFEKIEIPFFIGTGNHECSLSLTNPMKAVDIPKRETSHLLVNHKLIKKWYFTVII